MAAQTLLRYAEFRRLPVVDENGKLVGIVTDTDLDLFFSKVPSPGVTKRQYRVDQVMTTPVITVPPDYPLEEAAQSMLVHRVGGLPVLEEGKVVGVITETDILAQLVEALGGDIGSLRITVQVPDRPGQFARVAAEIAALNGNISSVLSARAGDRLNLTMRLQGIETRTVIAALRDLEEIDVIHVWESPEPGETSDRDL
jgi:acetoin utilization protein AcuB